MERFFLKIYGVEVEVHSASSVVIEGLKKDFALYLNEEGKGNFFEKVSVNIFKEKPPYEKVPPLTASLYNTDSICYKDKNVHYVDYSGKGLMIYDFTKENADIYSEDEALSYEKSRLAILSRVGEFLDRQHIHRLHAVGFSVGSEATICIMPMTAGKSTLCFHSLKLSQQIKILSDDVCLIGNNRIYPFVMRIGMRDKDALTGIPESYISKVERLHHGVKYLIDLRYYRTRISGECKVKNILIGKRTFAQKPEIKKISKLKTIGPFITSGVIGLGLPQIAELFLRFNIRDVFSKGFLAASRLFVFLRVIMKAETYEMHLSRDVERNSRELIRFMQGFT